ncbi:unnamed protein product [Aureobasidium mustum]|uniref:Uncharacterized protein n=1 Tax=Aureobasidium mustum TaxID=2773714 RepID=A0A9N8K9J3_9PEZI|nr:unnamed protein product [Aureobasidium mustum]
MAQVYQKSHYDYDGMQRSERRPSRGPLHTVDRGVPYVAYSTRPDPRNESRTYVLPTPIHDIGEDSDSGSARKRTSMAVGTSQTFDLDTSVGGPSPLAPISPYSPVTPNGTGYPAYPTDDRSSSVPGYGRSGYPQTSLPAYSYEMDTPAYAVSDDSRSWTTGSRSSTGVGYFQQESPATYDYSTPISRISSDSSEPLSPLNMSTLQHSLPLPLERRLPAPNFVGTPVTSDNDVRSPISARLASLSISGPYSRSNSASWPTDGIERRQPSIHDLAEASMMLPPVTRGLHATAATLPALSHDSAPMPTAMFVSSGSDGLIQASTSTTQPTYYSATTSALPSLTTGMLPPTNYARYTAINNSNSSLPVINTSDRTDTTSYYGWTPTNTSSTEVLPVINTVEITPQSNAGAERRNSSSQLSTGYPTLHHPRPKIIPSTPHATTLEKHDRVQQKDAKSQRPSSASSQHKSSSGSSSASSTKKNNHRPNKGSL